MNIGEVDRIDLRNLRIEDYIELKKSMIAAYPDIKESYWKEDQLATLLELFPEGQFCVLVNDIVVGSALSLIVNFEDFDREHTYREVTGNYTFSTHDPEGNVLYGIDVFISPKYRGLRLGRRLYEARKEFCEQMNLKGIIAGGRIPSYSKYSDEISPKEYIGKVRRKEIRDPVLGFQLVNDFHVIRIMKNYLDGDESSLEYATLLQWSNIYYQSRPQRVNAYKSVVRLGLVQWQMRPIQDLEGLFEQLEFFVDVNAGYNCDFLLFPELFNAPLMAAYNHHPEAKAIRLLASYTQRIKEKFQEFALSYNVNIITGSMPWLDEDERLYNVGFLCHRNGKVDRYEKLHITPNERSTWGMVGGNNLQVFETDAGKVGILVCYDVEFPELPRLLAQEGMEVLFVPFLTDTQNGYTRVRNCAMARAIENECYVAIAGCVGNLPKVENMDIQFAQSAVFTPADFAFPTNGVKAEATPNTEMTLIVDVDRDLLKQLHSFGAVRNLKDRRLDLYNLNRKK